MQRRARAALSGLAVLGLAAGLLAVGTALGSPREASAPPAGGGSSTAAEDPLQRLQRRLQERPADAGGWSTLGLQYVERARTTADPTYYGRADEAFAQSLQVQPEDNDVALTGQAMLAAARHDFAEALRLAERSLAVNGYSPTTWGVKTDALVELGRYDDALTAVQRMLDLRPAVDSLTRASYAAELRGRVDRAGELLEQAEASAQRPVDRAFVAHHLGELAWHRGDLPGALSAYDRALAGEPAYVPALAGRAKVLAAQGRTSEALRDYREAVQRQPAPQTLVELGALLEALGQRPAAEQQYEVVRATQQLFAAQGADVDLELALFEADHGEPAAALRYAETAYRTRPEAVLVQDAYAWALHRAGRSREALPVARRALRLGTRLPQLHYHLGAAAVAVGDQGTARRALSTALRLNPHFHPLQAPEARRLLRQLS